MKAFPNAWDIIGACLPKKGTMLGGYLRKPEYRYMQEVEEVSYQEASDLFVSYLDMCIEFADNESYRWNIILSALVCFDINIIKDSLNKLYDCLILMNDLTKMRIKNHIRERVYDFKKFEKNILNNKVQYFEDAILTIQFQQEEYIPCVL